VTATSACRIELEALRERLSTIIHDLRMAERMIDAFEVPATPPATPCPRPPAKTVVAAVPTPGLSDDARKIQKVVAATPDPLTIREIVQRAKLPLDRVRVALKALVRADGVQALGATSARVYTAITPRPGAVAGTQAAPPVGPPPATGTPQFETVWNGTKERNGDAPQLLPPRERKP
jgi:hypothetical protein